MRRFNEHDLVSLATPQTPMKNLAPDFENVSIKSSTGSAITVVEVAKAINEIEQKDKPSEKLLAALDKPVKEKEKVEVVAKPVKEDKPKEKVVEAPKQVQPPAKTVTPAFNQGPRSTPPSEMTKKLVVPATKPTPPAVVEEKTAFSSKDSVDTAMLRRNHQEMNAPPRLKMPLQRPPTPKIPKTFYSDLTVRDLTPGKHTVNAMNGEPAKKIFYVLEAFEEITDYCTFIESAVAEVVAENKITSYEPEVEEMVLAKFEGNYYRAISTSASKVGDKFLVFFIDYGNLAEVLSSEIIPFSPKLQMEIILHEVFIENLPVPFNKKAKEIIAKPEGFEIMVKEERTEKGSYIADLIGL